MDDEYIRKTDVLNASKITYIECLYEDAEGYIEGESDEIPVVFKRDIEAIPASDVRPVVTCGKCRNGKYTGTEWFCDKHSGHADKFGEDASYHEYHSKHYFCADGEYRNG